MQEHAANSSQQLAQRFPGAVQTPSQSFNNEQSIQTPDSQGMDWGSKSIKEEEYIMGRLTDTQFNIKHYEDPLLPRRFPPSHYNPKGVTQELEKHLLDLVANIKAGKA
ncbi:hypothetical protein GGS20DRAFT_547058 [Poronia punctata]|nr:hypothetical protein GGS20DRAFT_547058 [Poronia punctata]